MAAAPPALPPLATFTPTITLASSASLAPSPSPLGSRSSASLTVPSPAQTSSSQADGEYHWNEAYIIPWILVFVAVVSCLAVAVILLWKAYKRRRRERHDLTVERPVDNTEKTQMGFVTVITGGKRSEDSSIEAVALEKEV